ncbi:MAG: hypothetical protein KJ737_24005 [Proteobacteria bacterium]|nr:hypothetical protein [Pseudomonadota bacterium]
MQEITQEQMDILIDLQKIETESFRIKKIISSVDEKVSALNSRLTSFCKMIAEKEFVLKEMKDRYQIFESELNERTARIQKSRETLKGVSTHKEYQVLSREIDDNVNQNKKIEDVMIHDLELIEAAEKELSERKAEYAQMESQTKSEIEDIESESIEEKQQLDIIDLKKQEITPLVRPKLLAKFNKILNIAGGLAIVPVENGTCKGCNINLPPQKYIELQRGGILEYCQQCHRIIYHKAPEETET